MIAKRYKLLDKLGQGGMGIVYKAYDQLTGETVALKQVLVPDTALDFASKVETDDTTKLRLGLALEFRTLATLRHPNIISVLDYGFDEKHQPFFTMEYLEGAKPITTFAANADQTTKTRLLMDVLEALSYLHRRGTIHRDLKPDNVLVNREGVVHLMDFGLALSQRSSVTGTYEGLAGTLAYMAPELFNESQASVQSDLYAAGVIGYELFAGRYPFNMTSLPKLIFSIANDVPDTFALDKRLAGVLLKLMAKDPKERFADSRETMRRLASALDIPLPDETSAIRESYLQASRFVGREHELKTLLNGYQSTVEGQREHWLISGESGVGKSRLLEEFRSRVIIQGAIVLRGQAIAEGGAPFQMWREPLRQMVLQTELDELQAGVLKTIVPDINSLVRKDIQDAPEVEKQSARDRLLNAVEDIFCRQKQPVVLLLEDLHWADDSILILQRLIRTKSAPNLMIIGTYRHEEHPEIVGLLPEMKPMMLTRLDRESIVELAKSILGESEAEVIELLERETEGNAFFIVEVMRTLAEEAGHLTDVMNMPLPQSIFSGGIKMVVRRRLERIPQSAQKLLQVAAIASREVDLELLGAIEPGTNLENWLAQVNTVLDVQENRYRFSHDKLRDGVLADLSDEQRKQLHQQVAEILEQQHGDDPIFAGQLAYHWSKVGHIEKEGHYSAIAGALALEANAAKDAVTYLERALALTEQMGDDQRKQLENQLGYAYLSLGQIKQGQQHLNAALELMGFSVPQTSRQYTLSVIKESFQQFLHRAGISGVSLKKRPQEDYRRAVKIYDQFSQIHFFNAEILATIDVTLRCVNCAEQLHTAQAEQAIGYAVFGTMVNAFSRRLSNYYFQKALAIGRQSDDLSALGWVLTLNGLADFQHADWERATILLEEANGIHEQLANDRQRDSNLQILSDALTFMAEYDRSNSYTMMTTASASRRGDVQYLLFAVMGRLKNLFWSGHDFSAEMAETKRLLLLNEGYRTIQIEGYGLLAAAYLRLEDDDNARQMALKVREQCKDIFPQAYYCIWGLTGAAVTFLSLYEMTGEPELLTYAHDVYLPLKSFTRQAIGRPATYLIGAWYAQLKQNSGLASKLFDQAMQSARQYRMPYEEGLAHFHKARLMPDEKLAHLKQAVAIFERIGAGWDADAARRLMSGL